MKINDIILEAPLTDYVPLHMDPGKRFSPVDRRLIQHPTTRLKAIEFFKNSPYNFRLFFNGAPGLRQYQETGEHSVEDIKKIFKEDSKLILQGYENSITVVYLGNFGARKVMMTPWIMTHRAGHSIQATNRYGVTNDGQTTEWDKAENYFFKEINLIIENYYRKRIPKQSSYGKSFVYDNRVYYNALFNLIGTQSSSEKNLIDRPYEFLYELFTQYVNEGRIRLNPLPNIIPYGRKAWGRANNWLSLDQDSRDIELQSSITQELSTNMESLFNMVLKSCQGKIYLM